MFSFFLTISHFYPCILPTLLLRRFKHMETFELMNELNSVSWLNSQIFNPNLVEAFCKKFEDLTNKRSRINIYKFKNFKGFGVCCHFFLHFCHIYSFCKFAYINQKFIKQTFRQTCLRFSYFSVVTHLSS